MNNIQLLQKNLALRKIIMKGRNTQIRKNTNRKKIKILKDNRIFNNIHGQKINISVLKLFYNLDKMFKNECLDVKDYRIKNINEFIDCRFFYIFKDRIYRY